jgi:hypothetical protein
VYTIFQGLNFHETATNDSGVEIVTIIRINFPICMKKKEHWTFKAKDKIKTAPLEMKFIRRTAKY